MIKRDEHLSLEDFPKENTSFEGKFATYKVVKLLGKGGFGAVFQVQASTNNEMYAAKLESYDRSRKVLLMDCLVLRGAEMLGSPHFCKIFEVGKVVGRFRFVIITMLGSSLHVLRTSQPQHRFSLGTALRLAQQSLEALQDMHCIGFLHRDIKPSNFGIGRQETNDFHIVYIFDFGLARQFATLDKDCRLPRQTAPFRGTPRYASLSSHRRKEQSPKDDIESWFYMVVEWTVGALPWRRFRNHDRDQILMMKEQIREPDGADILLEGCPTPHYRMILNYIDNLQYASIPDYGYIYYLLKHIAKQNKIPADQPLDYDPEHPYNGTETPPSCLPCGVVISTLNEQKKSPKKAKTAMKQ
ncbi:unnamed protein product [Thelazia callipaeda]|uniref:Protein kinase domain-containing protein n=1 Tax=Thelazia callipaeda TaxID=103827 RepID=A0A0N5D7N2_THECL|nr:unnamed protein product [Thelazia callipaeda]